jgi:hypothetical protein
VRVYRVWKSEKSEKRKNPAQKIVEIDQNAKNDPKKVKNKPRQIGLLAKSASFRGHLPAGHFYDTNFFCRPMSYTTPVAPLNEAQGHIGLVQVLAAI